MALLNLGKRSELVCEMEQKCMCEMQREMEERYSERGEGREIQKQSKGAKESGKKRELDGGGGRWRRGGRRMSTLV